MSDAEGTVVEEQEASTEEIMYGSEESDESVEASASDEGTSEETQEGEEGEQTEDIYSELSFPEGAEVDEERLVATKQKFQKLGYTAEQAQGAVDMYSEVHKEIYDQFDSIKSDWEKESRTDSEYGQDKFDASIGMAGKAIDTFGNEGLLNMLEETGVGNHPEMIRFMFKVGQALQEDSPNSGILGGQGTELSREEILYPNS